ncbi:seminal plasma protein HSP-1-like [Scleropages formosus]|uniref:seminal plasma protein HSP-1-like n=1 Tax=Scleropages formosus TaxID=113540 RepID=UPI0008788A45|nr:seminal plasma protein HSP-1-like [Scleropages formosus]
MLQLAVIFLLAPAIGGQVIASWQTKVKVQDISPDYCVFPFKYKDHWYYSCTSVDSKHKRLWCSLTTDFDKDHLWGYCLGNVNFWVTTTESSCVFPFIAGGKTYNHCTTDYWFPGISWCSTTANYDGDKKWVYCPSSGVQVSSIRTGR